MTGAMQCFLQKSVIESSVTDIGNKDQTMLQAVTHKHKPFIKDLVEVTARLFVIYTVSRMLPFRETSLADLFHSTIQGSH